MKVHFSFTSVVTSVCVSRSLYSLPCTSTTFTYSYLLPSVSDKLSVLPFGFFCFHGNFNVRQQKLPLNHAFQHKKKTPTYFHYFPSTYFFNFQNFQCTYTLRDSNFHRNFFHTRPQTLPSTPICNRTFRLRPCGSIPLLFDFPSTSKTSS